METPLPVERHGDMETEDSVEDIELSDVINNTTAAVPEADTGPAVVTPSITQEEGEHG